MPRSSKHLQQKGILQADLFAGLSPLQTRLIARRNDFEELFDGFIKMRAISYVVSPDLLLEFLEQRGYSEVEIVVGENLSEVYRKDLEQKGVEVTGRLAEYVERDVLRIFIPTRTIHTKLYILERPELVRVIQTSANLTVTAQEARRQINYAWYLDIPSGHPLLTQLNQDYQSHLHGCSLFMEDLKELLKQGTDTDRKKLIEVWLKGTITEDQDVEIRGIFHQISASLVEAADSKEERVTVLQLPESELARKKIERHLLPMKPIAAGQNQVHVNNSAFIRYVYETHRIPLLILSRERGELLLGLDAPLKILTEVPPDSASVDQGLESIEAYLNTVDLGESANPLSAKTSMFEALLYLFSTPFANEYMKAKRARFGIIDTRGPRFLYIYGPSQNGKTTFLRFALKLMTGNIIEPLSRQDFTKTRITNTMLTESTFPLVFDDVDPSRTPGIEEVFKSYWERWWRDQYVSPQIVISSNSPRLKEWAKSRVKRIDFDVHFAPSEDAKERLARLFSQDNSVFKWFSHLYINHLDSNELPSDDELRLARTVMRQLYEYAQRPLPAFFPARPIEELYDPGRRDWQDLLFRLRKATVEQEGDRKLATFSKDMQHWEINDYQGYLPQTVKYQRKGNTIIIENPKEFDRWLGQPPRAPSLLARVFKKKA
ncbi:MAG: phospholipase D family protein [Dehalococcoidia bacterium]|nr:phospholipase D family protein [Dehalococcoidia bacterium]